MAVVAATNSVSLNPPRIIAAAAVVAVLDISFAATYWVIYRGAISFQRLLQSIATGLLGKAAFTGGTNAAIVGAIAHCTVALGWCVIFALLVARWQAFRHAVNRPAGALLVGLPFGMFIWLAMNFVVTPLSHASPTAVTSSWFTICLVWHAVGVGVPMAAILRDSETR